MAHRNRPHNTTQIYTLETNPDGSATILYPGTFSGTWRRLGPFTTRHEAQTFLDGLSDNLYPCELCRATGRLNARQCPDCSGTRYIP